MSDETIAAEAAPDIHNESRAGGGFLSATQILDATEACFFADGYDGTTIRAIAARLGCAVGSIYRYFPDKRSLLGACAARRFDAVIEGLDAGDDLRASQRRYATEAIERPELYRLMFFLAADGLPAAVAEVVHRWTQLSDNRDTAVAAWVATHGAAMLGDADAVDRRVNPLPFEPRSNATPPREDVTLL